LFSIAYTGQQLVFAAKMASIERGGHGRARIIADKTNKARRQFALSAFYRTCTLIWKPFCAISWDAPSSISATRTSFIT